jgi:large subunit ribosomal protein L21
MFAVFKNGGKQYRVAEGQVLKLEKFDATLGEEIEINEVMMVGGEGTHTTVGAPHVAGASVKIQLVGYDQDKKVIIFKKRRRKNFRRKTGHRQLVSLVKVMSITQGK